MRDGDRVSEWCVWIEINVSGNYPALFKVNIKEPSDMVTLLETYPTESLKLISKQQTKQNKK
jgi:hypothetical protein